MNTAVFNTIERIVKGCAKPKFLHQENRLKLLRGSTKLRDLPCKSLRFGRQTNRTTALITDRCSTSLNDCNVNGTYVCENQYNGHTCLCKNGYVGSRCERGKVP